MSKLLWSRTFSSEIQQGVGVADLVVGVVALKGAVVDLKEGVTVKVAVMKVGVTVKAAATKVGVTVTVKVDVIVKAGVMKVGVTVKEAGTKVGVTVKEVDTKVGVAEAVDKEVGGDSTGVTGLPTWKTRGTSPL